MTDALEVMSREDVLALIEENKELKARLDTRDVVMAGTRKLMYDARAHRDELIAQVDYEKGRTRLAKKRARDYEATLHVWLKPLVKQGCTPEGMRLDLDELGLLHELAVAVRTVLKLIDESDLPAIADEDNPYGWGEVVKIMERLDGFDDRA